MKNGTVKALALLCALLIALTLFPCLSCAKWTENDVWEDDFTAIRPVDDAPYAKMKLTVTGYEFTEWHIPERYELTLPDGSTREITMENPMQIGNAGPGQGGSPRQAGYQFETEVDGEPCAFAATLTFHEKERQCVFTVWQLERVDEEDGSDVAAPVATLLREPCETEVDRGGIFTRIGYWFYGVLEKINDFVMEHFHVSFL